MTNLLRRSEYLMDEVASKLKHIEIPDLASERSLLAYTLFKIAIDHGQAIVILVGHGCNTSALALQRPCFEAFVRGVWVKWCVTCNEVTEVSSRDNFNKKGLGAMAAEIRTKGVLQSDVLQCIKQENWNRWCSLTHGGMEQIVGQWSTDGIESNYDPVEIQQALYCADLLQLLSAAQIAIGANDENLVWYFYDRFKSYDNA